MIRFQLYLRFIWLLQFFSTSFFFFWKISRRSASLLEKKEQKKTTTTTTAKKKKKSFRQPRPIWYWKINKHFACENRETPQEWASITKKRRRVRHTEKKEKNKMEKRIDLEKRGRPANQVSIAPFLLFHNQNYLLLFSIFILLVLNLFFLRIFFSNQKISQQQQIDVLTLPDVSFSFISFNHLRIHQRGKY